MCIIVGHVGVSLNFILLTFALLQFIYVEMTCIVVVYKLLVMNYYIFSILNMLNKHIFSGLSAVGRTKELHYGTWKLQRVWYASL